MVADLALLAVERRESAAIRDKAERDRQRVLKALAEIRRMTRIYQERLDGKRDV